MEDQLLMRGLKLESNSLYSEDIDRKKVIEIISTSEKLDRDIQDRILKKIEHQFSLEYSPRYFKINKITTNENRNTEYPGFSASISTETPITVIKGPNGTGKTTTFEKIHHPFLTPIPSRLITSRWVTKLEMEIQETNVDQNKYKIKFHSQNGFEGKKFQAFIEKDGFYSELPNAERFLKESLFTDYELNCLMFIPETSSNSIVHRFCTEEEKFRRLFRFSSVNYVFDTIQKEQENLNEIINQIHGTLSGDQVELERIKYFTRIHIKSMEKDKFLIENEKNLLEAKKIFDESEVQKRKEGREIIREIRRLDIQGKKMQKELEDLDRILVPQATDRIELFRGQQIRQCWECGSIIPPDEFGKRVRRKPPLCYICGIGEVDYSIEMSTVPEEDLSELKKKQNTLKNEIKKIEEQRDKLTRAYDEFLPKPNKFSLKIWKRAISFPEESDLVNEIALTNKRISETDNELRNLENIGKEIELQYQNKKKKRDEYIEDYDRLEKIKKEITNLEEEEYQDLKNEIFNDVNQALMDLSYESAGRISFDDEGILNLETQIVLDVEKDQRINRKQKYISADFSPGQFRKIDFAFVLSLIKTMVKRKKIPINAVFIDSLNYLSSDDRKFLLEGLANLPEFKVVVFSLEEPTYLSKDIYEVIPITRNSRVVKPDTLRNMNRHTTLDEFFT